MSQEIPVPRQEARSDEVPGGQPTGAESSPPGIGRRVLSELARDSRLVPVLAALGAVTAFASLVGEWTVATLPVFEPDGDGPTKAAIGLWGLGAFGTAYLGGLLGMAVCLTLARFGTPAVRHNARLAGLATMGGLLLLLVGTATALDELTERAYIWTVLNQGTRIEYGRGLVTAFAATVAIGLALFVTGRAPSDVDDRNGSTAEETGPGTGWLARRRRTVADEPVALNGPSDLTVTPVAPFLDRPFRDR